MGSWAPAATALVVGVAFLALLGLALSPGKNISTVIIPEGSSLANVERNNFEPAIIKVVVGINNTMQWVNQDLTLHSVRADDGDDPDFYRATQDIFLMPGETFEYTFTKPGKLGYHMEPHPHMRGTVILLES